MKISSIGPFILVFLLGTMSCTKDEENQDCEFIGKWCTESPINPGDCYAIGIKMEFKSNGELIQSGALAFNWESEDCIRIDLIHRASGQNSGEYTVVSVSEDELVLDIGTVAEFIREN